MSIQMGDKNNIKNSVIGHNNQNIAIQTPEKKSFAEKHPILISVLVSFVVGFILLFSFWKNVVEWVENLF
ncbi:hypothetical protein [Bacillus cereus group sp. BfR-BA-01347]|uniref:hypothetical protein n=1 Tax=Bacillus cereus group sp. BfR-BA-01347 TaxID=2920310 RepID=UPI001F57690B|nr:hypothetical protein [Bacillus cereus group sp. BfR-BA-01347]